MAAIVISDYLTRTDITNLVPKNIAVKLGNSNFLFLGYSRPAHYPRWTILFNPDQIVTLEPTSRACNIVLRSGHRCLG